MAFSEPYYDLIFLVWVNIRSNADNLELIHYHAPSLFCIKSLEDLMEIGNINIEKDTITKNTMQVVLLQKGKPVDTILKYDNPW